MKKRTKSYQSAERVELIRQGFYDGRFSSKIVKDKKKESSKIKARKKIFV